MGALAFTDIYFHYYDPFDDYDKVEKLWKTMLAKCSHSFFLSWGWVSAWLQTLPPETQLKLIVGRVDGVPVVAFFLGKQKKVRHGLIPSHVISLNATGDAYYDDICIEYNRILTDSTFDFSLDDLITTQCLSCPWDEFALPGIYNNHQTQLMRECSTLDAKNITTVYERQPDVFWVDLEKIRDNGMDYLALLSRKTRQKIRRSTRAYEESGKIQILTAGNSDESHRMLNKLAQLHVESWANRGKTGAFSKKYFLDFHHHLISNCYPKGEVQLLHISNSRATIGYLYNFIFNGDVLFYQCAFNFRKNNKFSAGLTSLILAITAYADSGYKTFNFLAGSVQYKKSLSTDNEKMCWAVLQKNRKRFVLERKLQSIKEDIIRQVNGRRRKK